MSTPMTEDEWLAAAPAEPKLRTIQRLFHMWGLTMELVAMEPQHDDDVTEPDEPEPAPGDTDVVDRFSAWASTGGR